MKYDFFFFFYSQIMALYYDYINKEESWDNPVVKFAELTTSELIKKAFNEMKDGKEDSVFDTLADSQVLYQQSGFILGFTFAVKLMQESLSDKM